MTTLAITRTDDIVEIQLNRPDKRNAMSFAMVQELRVTASKLAGDRRLRAVILSGAGESFCSGIDLADMNQLSNRWLAFWQLIKPGQSSYQQACLRWRQLPVPVIAALHGHCFGAGMQLALGADIRMAEPSTELSIMEARWGLVPDMGLSESLRGVIAADQAKDLCFSARRINGDEACRLGLVTRCVDQPRAAAWALAREYAQRSPDALLAAKRVIQAMHDRRPSRSLALEKRWQLKLLLGKNSAVARAQAKNPSRAFFERQY